MVIIMDKNKKELIVLILLLFIGANYLIYHYYLVPLQNKLVLEKKKYTQALALGNETNSKNNKLKQLQQTQEKLKNDSATLETLTVKEIDTPQLIYDFYNSCKKYGITGDDVSFDLNGTADQSQSSNTVSQQNTNQQTGNNSQNTNNASDKSKSGNKLLKLSITLNVNGDNDNMENYIRNLNTITNRKLNVKSIELKSIGTQNVSINPSTLTQLPQITGSNSTVQSTPQLPQVQVTPGTSRLSATIVFYQYLLTDGKEISNKDSYDFYHENIGFDSIAKMFK